MKYNPWVGSISTRYCNQSEKDVRFGSKADVMATNADVRFVPATDIARISP
jgi:hypothetical protein